MSKENLEAHKVLKKKARREIASMMESRWIEMARELEKKRQHNDISYGMLHKRRLQWPHAV